MKEVRSLCGLPPFPLPDIELPSNAVSQGLRCVPDGLHCGYAILLQILLCYFRTVNPASCIRVEQPVNLVAIAVLLACTYFFIFSG